jgi:hypothetical protein
MSGPLDEFGYPAYSCATDGLALEPVAGDAAVLRCRTCGLRTDAPGAGVLGDGFDIVHRQWGLRGDPHAWRALRELVAATPTPSSEALVRQAFVDGLREVADVDIDHTDEQQVYRRHLDHGGMSGGGVNVEWWRTKGIPLLVERAVARRPTSVIAAEPTVDDGRLDDGRLDDRTRARRSLRSKVTDVAVWALIMSIPAALVGGGGWLLYQRGFGTQVRATVLECETSGNFRRSGSTFRTDCIAEWTLDGRTVVGGFTGGNGVSDVGRTVDATVRGDTAYSRSLGLPVLLVALGLPFLLLPIAAIRGRRRRGSDDGPRPRSTGLAHEGR